MDGKGPKIAVAVAIGVVALVGWMFVRFLLLDMHVAEVMTNFPRHPEVANVLALKDQVLEKAKKVKVSPDEIEVEVTLEQKNIGGGGPSAGAGMAVGDSRADRWWFVVVRVWKKGRSGKPSVHMKRMENSIADTQAETFEKNGIKLKRM